MHTKPRGEQHDVGVCALMALLCWAECWRALCWSSCMYRLDQALHTGVAVGIPVPCGGGGRGDP